MARRPWLAAACASLIAALGAACPPASHAASAETARAGAGSRARGTPPRQLGAADLAVIVNAADPLSVAIADYYLQRRAIPRENVARVSFDPQRDELPVAEFSALRAQVVKQLPAHVQAYALTWARPYRVGCMSITSAFTFGVDPGYCSSGCARTRPSPYFNKSISRPYDELGMRPSMSIAALDFEHAQALIDRGVRADGSAPPGTAYLVRSADPMRNVREAEYPLAVRVAQHEFNFRVVTGDQPGPQANVMFYFTGATWVAGLTEERFLPGALADHLTSYGGRLTDSSQMSSLRWLEAGATGSYGTVVEPCNLLGKFPNVAVLLAHYLAGETLIESYWKSVLMPGQGLFIGEPLAAPFRTRRFAGDTGTP
jgi:uncharacterized protein (TIGR03790 family)